MALIALACRARAARLQRDSLGEAIMGGHPLS
jgi:hypothetical protein